MSWVIQCKLLLQQTNNGQPVQVVKTQKEEPCKQYNRIEVPYPPTSENKAFLSSNENKNKRIEIQKPKSLAWPLSTVPPLSLTASAAFLNFS